MENISQEALDLLESVMEEQHKEIPENNKVYLVEDNTSRFSSAIWYSEIQNTPVLLAGLGGIGSWLALMLSRVNIKELFLYDFDRIDGSNMSGQLYSNSNIGQYKTFAISNTLHSFSRFYDVRCFNEPYSSSSGTSNIMICGFDNMEARKVFFKNWCKHVKSALNKNKCLFIDGRLNAEEFQVIAFTGDNTNAINEYSNKWLFDDSDVEEAICSYKQTSFMANMIASVMTNILVNHIANLCSPIFPRDIPFFISYSADTMFTKTVIV